MPRTVELSNYSTYKDPRSKEETAFFKTPDIPQGGPLIQQTINAISEICAPCPMLEDCRPSIDPTTLITGKENLKFTARRLEDPACRLPRSEALNGKRGIVINLNLSRADRSDVLILSGSL